MINICIHVHIYIYILYTYIYIYIHTYVRTYVHTYIHTYIHTYLPTYIHTYIHTFLHTYIHYYYVYYNKNNDFCLKCFELSQAIDLQLQNSLSSRCQLVVEFQNWGGAFVSSPRMDPTRLSGCGRCGRYGWTGEWLRGYELPVKVRKWRSFFTDLGTQESNLQILFGDPNFSWCFSFWIPLFNPSWTIETISVVTGTSEQQTRWQIAQVDELPKEQNSINSTLW